MFSRETTKRPIMYIDRAGQIFVIVIGDIKWANSSDGNVWIIPPTQKSP